MVGIYRIENTSSEHASVLKYMVMAWGERQPDIYLVSKEGVKVYTQRVLLSFYSKTLGELLDGNRDDLAGVSVPASSSSLTMMLKVLVSGSVIANTKDDLLEVGQAAEALGIVLNDRQIGYKKTNKLPMAGKGVVKETVQISGKKVAYRKSVNSASEIKTEPMEESNEEDMDLSVNAASDLKDRTKLKKTKKKSVDGSKLGIVDDKTCATCGKVFPSAGRLTLHMNVHKDEKERPYQCDVCEKGFSAPASLKNHKLLHTGEKLKCEYCDYTAVQKGYRGDQSGGTEMKEDIRNEEHVDVSENNEPEKEVVIEDNEEADEEKTIEQEDKIIGVD